MATVVNQPCKISTSLSDAHGHITALAAPHKPRNACTLSPEPLISVNDGSNIRSAGKLGVRPKLHYTDTGYGHVVGYNTTNGRARNNSTTNLPHRNARAQHLDMSRCWDVANFCRLVVNLLYSKL